MENGGSVLDCKDFYMVGLEKLPYYDKNQMSLIFRVLFLCHMMFSVCFFHIIIYRIP